MLWALARPHPKASLECSLGPREREGPGSQVLLLPGAISAQPQCQLFFSRHSPCILTPSSQDHFL